MDHGRQEPERERRVRLSRAFRAGNSNGASSERVIKCARCRPAERRRSLLRHVLAVDSAIGAAPVIWTPILENPRRGHDSAYNGLFPRVARYSPMGHAVMAALGASTRFSLTIFCARILASAISLAKISVLSALGSMRVIEALGD